MLSFKKTFYISAVFAVVITALIFLALYPLFAEIKENSQRLLSLKKEQFLFERPLSFNRISQEYTAIEPDVQRIEDHFIDPGVPIDLIEFWEKTAAASNISIAIAPVSIKSGPTDTWASTGFQIVLSGSFSGLSRFLEKIENSLYLTEVRNLNVRRITEQDLQSSKYKELSVGDVLATVTIKAFTR